MQCCSLPMSMNSYCYQESQVLDSVSNFMIVNIPIWDATINRICVNDESNTKHLQLHAMLVAANVHEFILLSRISILGKRKQFYESNILNLRCDYQQNLWNVVSKEIWKAFMFFRSSNFQKISVDQKVRHDLHVFGETFPPKG